MSEPVTTAQPSHEPDRFSWLKWIDRFSTLLAIIGGVATGFLVLQIVVDVIARFGFNRPIPGTLDVSSFIWMPILISCGLAYCLYKQEHIRVSLFTAPTPPPVQRVIEVVGMVLTFAAAATLAYFTVEKSIDATQLNEHAIGSTWLLVWPARWVVVLGLVALAMQAIAQIIRALTVEVFVPSDEDELAEVAL